LSIIQKISEERDKKTKKDKGAGARSQGRGIEVSKKSQREVNARRPELNSGRHKMIL